MHDFPLPKHPSLQVHTNELNVLLQFALMSQLLVPNLHSSISTQVNPSPWNPSLHKQLEEPILFWYILFLWQLFEVKLLHSLISTQLTPLPWNPELQKHQNEPILFTDFACLWQLSSSVIHSLKSEQLKPMPF